MNLNVIVHILRLNSHEQRSEPLERSEIPANPEEIYFSEPSLLFRVVHTVPDALEDGGKRSHANSSTNEDCNLILENVLRRASKGPIKVHSRQYSADSRVPVGLLSIVIQTYDLRLGLFVFVESAANGFGERLCEITNTADVNREIVFFWGASQRKWMILPY